MGAQTYFHPQEIPKIMLRKRPTMFLSRLIPYPNRYHYSSKWWSFLYLNTPSDTKLRRSAPVISIFESIPLPPGSTFFAKLKLLLKLHWGFRNGHNTATTTKNNNEQISQYCKKNRQIRQILYYSTERPRWNSMNTKNPATGRCFVWFRAELHGKKYLKNLLMNGPI